MTNPKPPTSAHEKERIRAEINDHIAEFLNRGGKIDILTGEQKSGSTNVGSAWHHSDDTANLVP